MADEQDKTTEQAETEKKQETLTIDQVNALINARFTKIEKIVEGLASAKTESKKPEAEEPEKLSRTAQLEAKVKQLTEEREAEKAAARDLRVRSSLKDQFAKHGVPNHFQKALMAQLVDSDKLVAIGDDDSIVFRGRFGDTELETGLADFFKSEDGKAFLPPKGVQGSNDRRQTGPSHAAGQKVSEAEGEQMLRALLSGDRN